MNVKEFLIAIALTSSLFSEEGLLSWWGCSKREPEPVQEPPPRRICCSDKAWKVWGDFLYWQPIQENLDPAALYTSTLLIDFTGTDSATIVNMDFDYKPAFAVGAGIIINRMFDLGAEYTWFHNTQRKSRSNNPYYPMQLGPTIFLSWLNGLNEVNGLGGAVPSAFEQTWDLDMDLIDVEFGHYYFSCKVLKLRPFVGVRGAIIDQELKTHYKANLINGGPEIGTANMKAHTTSWGVGIRGGLDMACKLGGGFKFYANGAGDLLYTQYNWHARSEAIVTDLLDRVFEGSQKRIPTVRAHLDAELGFLWGRSYCIGEYLSYFDLSLGYGFQVFLNQNMFRHFTTSFEEVGLSGGEPVLLGAFSTPISNAPNGNLYIQGLRLRASFTY